MTRGLRSWIRVRFIAGFFAIVPVVLTVWVLWIFYQWVDGLLSPLYEQMLGRRVPALGFFTAVALILLTGVIVTNVVGQQLVRRGERLLLVLPIIRRVYPAVKELVEAFAPERRSGFREFVLIEHPREGAFTYGFLTGDVRVGKTPGGVLASVYVPTNHLYLGDIVLVPPDSVVPTGLSIEEGIRIVLSAGTAGPGRISVSRLPQRSRSS